jgi:dsDNA-binding SOS-regulon protein
MKKLLMIAFLFCSTASFAQGKLFNGLLLEFARGKKADMEKARIEIDKIMADPKNQSSAEAWLWKARVYSELYFDSAYFKKYPGAGFIAVDAIKKYEALEPSYKMMAGEKWRPVDLVYVAGFNAGKKFFETKEWDSSFAYFEGSAYMGDIIVKNNVRNNGAKLDTLTVIYTGYAAQNAKKNAEAVKYYSRLADNKIAGEDYKDIYPYLLVYFAEKKDAASFNKYLAISRELYPKGDWDDYEADFIGKAYTLAQKVEEYDKADAAGTLSARKYLLFGQMFTELNKDEKAAMDSTKQVFYQKKAADAFKKAFNKDNSLSIAAFNAGVILYNEFGFYDERYRAGVKVLQELNSNKPIEKDPKKKVAADAKFKEKYDAQKKLNTDTEKSMQEVADQAIEWLEKSYNSMKDIPKKDRTTVMCLNRSVDYLASIFEYKMSRVKGKDPKAYDAFEAKFKFYDGLHASFK